MRLLAKLDEGVCKLYMYFISQVRVIEKLTRTTAIKYRRRYCHPLRGVPSAWSIEEET